MALQKQGCGGGLSQAKCTGKWAMIRGLLLGRQGRLSATD